MKIFLSYASEDRSTAEAIAFSLRDCGHEVFLDKDALRAGEGFDKSIERAVSKSNIFILLISPKSVAEGRYTPTEAHQDANEGALSKRVDTVSTPKKRTARQELDAIEDALIQSILQADYQSLRDEYVSRGLNPDHAIAAIDDTIERAKSLCATQQLQRAKSEVTPLHSKKRELTSTEPEIARNRFERTRARLEGGVGDPNAILQAEEPLLGEATPKLVDRVRTLWQMLSLRYAIASTAAIIFIVGLVELLSFLHGSSPPNRPDAYATSKDAEMVIVWPSTPQAGVALCNELRAGRVVCSFVQGRDQAQSILAVSMPRDKVAEFCKKVEASGNVCESSFMASTTNNTAR
jgi:hypothetical protein